MANKDKEKKLAIYRAWPWISNCWEWDSNSGLSGIESSALTTRPSRLGANLRRDATSRLLFLDQSVLADFDPRKKKKKSRILRLVAFQARVIRKVSPVWLGEVSALERVQLQRYKCNLAGTKFVRFREVSGLESVRLERVDCTRFQSLWISPTHKLQWL